MDCILKKKQWVLLGLLLVNVLQVEGQRNPFFAFNNGVRSIDYDTPAKQVTLLKNLGYDGMEKGGFDNIDEILLELDRQKLQLFTIYVNVNLDPTTPHYDARLPAVLQKLKGRKTMLWLNITSKAKTYAASSPAGDTTAIRIVREIADLAETTGTRIILYPHIWFWLEDFEKGVDLVKRIDRKNVGITFNLPHYLALKPQSEIENIPTILRKAKPYLFAVSICGATPVTDEEKKAISEQAIWDYLIQPLGEGTFNNLALLNALKNMGYEGPIGLQCYNIKGDKLEILSKSISWWNKNAPLK
ncbi:sugar phosphate isomerase/epimerase family protein [Spirosoma areae]